MMTPDRKTLTIKTRGIQGCAKTEFLLAIARFARKFGMMPALTRDGHNMEITSTKEQRLALYAFNHSPGGGAGIADWPAPACRQLLPDGDVG